MEKISKHISFKEAIKSNTALRRGIDNKPRAYEKQNMEILPFGIISMRKQAFYLVH